MMEGREGERMVKCVLVTPQNTLGQPQVTGENCVCVLTCAMVGGECAQMMVVGGGEMFGGWEGEEGVCAWKP